MRCVILLLACAGAPPPAAAMVELVDADGAPYREGQEVTLVAGAQGGYHVWLGWRMTPAPSPGEELQLERMAHRVSDGALVLRFDTTIDDGTAPLVPMFMCPVPVGLPILDQPIEYQLSFSNGARGAVTLVPHCPADSVDVCQRICTG